MNTLWKLPVPSSSLDGVSHGMRPRRTMVLTFTYVGDNDATITTELQFVSVAAYKCSFLPALTAEAVKSSYDRLVDLGETPWLVDVIATAQNRRMDDRLKHLRITFDDGPCFDVICKEHLIIPSVQ